MTPSIWMEARCGSVASVTSANWTPADGCLETAEGGFFSSITPARKHFLTQGWKIIDGEWWCPCCARKLLSLNPAKNRGADSGMKKSPRWDGGGFMSGTGFPYRKIASTIARSENFFK